MIGKYVCVFTASGDLEASSLISFLESMEIPALKSQESAGLALGFNIGQLGTVDILVPVAFADRALDVLTRMEDGEYAADDDKESGTDKE